MTVDEFWDYIEEAASDPSREQAEELIKELEKLTVQELADYKLIFNEYMHSLDNGLLAAACLIANGYISDDYFTDFRSWVISLGRERYLSILKDPNCLAEAGFEPGTLDFESLIYVSAIAAERKGLENEYWTQVVQNQLSENVRNEIHAEIANGPDLGEDCSEEVYVKACKVLNRLYEYVERRHEEYDWQVQKEAQEMREAEEPDWNMQ